MNRRVPETLRLLVQHRYRHGATGHIERGDEIADQRSCNDDAGWFEQFTNRVIHQIKFRKRRSAKTVDQQDGFAGCARPQVGGDGANHLRRDLGRRSQLDAAATRLAMDTDGDLHLKAFRSAKLRPCSAAAPTILSTINLPAPPRRPVEKVDFSIATSSSVITVAIDFPDISRAISKFMTSPS